MSSPQTEKTAVDQPSEKTLELDIHSRKSIQIESANTEDAPLTAEEAGDAALANAPWQYKLVALITALLFPRKKKNFDYYQTIFLIDKL
jgi:hypothetical protein